MKKLAFLIGFFLTGYSVCGLTASFTSNVAGGCAPLVVNFLDNSSGAPISWEYDFGDGGTSSSQNPRYTFVKAGKYTVKLTVFDGSDYSTASLVINVRKLPKADFSTIQTEFCPGTAIKFTNLTTMGDTTIKSASWDFGDGNVVPSTGDVTKTYSASGSFTVKLTVRDNHNCVSTVSKPQFVIINDNPVPAFGFGAKYSCKSPQRVNFANNSSNSVSYDWDFGDGTKGTDYNPVVFYNTAKTYTVTLKTTSAKGCQASISKSIIVKFDKIKADFTAEAFAGCIPFDPKLTNACLPTGASFDYLWNFGDGTKSTSPNPSKQFPKTGTYKVSLRIKGSDITCADSITKTILVSDKPKAVLSITDTVACIGELNTKLKAESPGVGKFTWFIDNLNLETTGDSLKYKFTKPGIYNVVVLLEDAAGCQKSYKFPRVVVQKLTAGYTYGEYGGCAPYSPNIDDTSSCKLSSPISYEWDDGQGNQYFVPEPRITYNKTGTYDLVLKIRDQFGCTDEFPGLVKVGFKVKPDFTMNKTAICINETIRFDNTTHDTSFKKVNSWRWELSSENSSNARSFTTFLRETPGKMSPRLISEVNECRDTLEKKDSLTMMPPFSYFMASFDTCYSITGRIKSISSEATEIKWLLPDGKNSSDSQIYYRFPNGGKLEFALFAYNKISGCRDTFKEKIGPPVPVSNIKATPRNYCTPQVFLIDNFETGSVTNHWDFGNGDTLNAPDTFSYIYREPGKYKIKHRGKDLRGCLDSSETTVVVNGPKLAARVWPDKGCLPLKLQLQDSFSSGRIKRKYWKFEDDAQWIKAGNKNEIIEYTIKNMPLSGDSFFHIELMLEDSNGCTSSKFFKIRPSGPRTVNEIDVRHGCDASVFSFASNLDSATATYPIEFSWDLGDGNIKKTDRFTYTYKKGGKYAVVLKIKDGFGCTYEETMTVSCTDPEILALFSTGNNEVKCPPLITGFTNQSIADPNNPIISYYWNFGDGSSSTLASPSKIYTVPGKYNVSLTVYNSFGCSNTMLMEGLIQVGGPVAIPKFFPNEACFPQTIEFSALTAEGTKAVWDFGDGYNSNSKSAVYRYEKPGVYFPKLLLTDSSNCSSVYIPSDSVILYASPDADFEVSSQCLDDEIIFTNKSLSNSKLSNEVFSLWNIEGDTSSNSGYKIRFTADGKKQVWLYTENIHGCKDTLFEELLISKPEALITSGNTRLCLGDSLSFTDKSRSETVITGRQYFLNNIPATPPLRPGKGDFELKLIITDSLGCKDTFAGTNNFHIADTVSDEIIHVNRISHISDKVLELHYTKSSSADFDSYLIYVNGSAGDSLIRRVKNIDSVLLLFPKNNNIHSECFNVRQSNYCGAESETSLWHCSIHTTVIPGNNSNKLNWNPYTAWQPEQYKIQRQDIYNTEIYHDIAMLDGGQNSYTDSSVACHRTHAYRVMAIGQNSEEYSMSDTAMAKANWENRLPVPVFNLATVNQDTSVILNWNKGELYTRTNYTNILLYELNLKGGVKAVFEPETSNYNDKRVNVDLNAYRYRIRVKDDCGDTSAYSNHSGNILLYSVKNSQTDAPSLKWNAYRDWPGGVSHYEIQRFDENNKPLTIAISKDTGYTDYGQESSCQQNYIYRVIAVSQMSDTLRSVSNTIRVRPASTLFAPNAFSPDGNGINEVFAPKGQFIYNYRIEIYNRWGERVFESNNCFEGWDGSYKSMQSDESVFYYRISAFGADGKTYILKGSISLLR